LLPRAVDLRPSPHSVSAIWPFRVAKWSDLLP
jgi:hypothetical protein